MSGFNLASARPQQDLGIEPYDHWLTPDNGQKAGFYRTRSAYLVRFYDEADFAIDAATLDVTCWPTPDCGEDVARSLFQNAITPILANHQSGLNLHGSAVADEAGALAFLGYSRSGKTTLAGAFCKIGLAFLTEDVVELEADAGQYLVQPKPADFRLFSDSAEYMFGSQIKSDWVPPNDGEERKQSLGMPPDFIASSIPVKLRALFLMGDGSAEKVSLAKLDSREALTQLLQHSFILDVEDKQRLRAHFSRLADLVDRTPCFTLDYPRQYSELSAVVEAVRGQMVREVVA